MPQRSTTSEVLSRPPNRCSLITSATKSMRRTMPSGKPTDSSSLWTVMLLASLGMNLMLTRRPVANRYIRIDEMAAPRRSSTRSQLLAARG